MADFQYVSQADANAVNTGPKPPLDFSHHYSRVTAARQASTVKQFYKYFQIPGMGNLAGGKSYDRVLCGGQWDILIMEISAGNITSTIKLTSL